MRRHASLRELSVDHHHALVQAHRLIKAAMADEATRSEIAGDFLRFWHEQANRHFREEEEALLPYFALWREVDQPAINQMLREHILIRRDAGEMAEAMAQSTPKPQLMRMLGERLEAHVRHEERVVFPLIEAALDEEKLAILATRLKEFKS